jgi:predicted nucleic acid-binding protein
VRIALDSNLLIYLAKVWKVDSDGGKTAQFAKLLKALRGDVSIVMPLQALGEACRVMLRFGYSHDQCRALALGWLGSFEPVGSDASAFLAALDLSTNHKLQFWDALIVNVADDAGCQLLLSEDMQSGFVWRGVTVVNPLAETLDERLVRILDAPQ